MTRFKVEYDPCGWQPWSAWDDTQCADELGFRQGLGKTRQDALLDLWWQCDSICPDMPSEGLCWEVNPDLWQFYCLLHNRRCEPSDLWTEIDVVLAIDHCYSAGVTNSGSVAHAE